MSKRHIFYNKKDLRKEENVQYGQQLKDILALSIIPTQKAPSSCEDRAFVRFPTALSFPGANGDVSIIGCETL